MEGRAQQTLAAITPPSMARVDWHIVRAVSELSNHTLEYETLVQLRARMAKLAPALVQYNKNLSPAAANKEQASQSNNSSGNSPPPKVGSNQKLNPLLRELTDYYQTDVISRASATMAKCVQAVTKEQTKRQRQKSIQQ